jgi:hypothetical protein
MASLAPKPCSVGLLSLLAVLEFSMMRICMACRASGISKTEGQDLVFAIPLASRVAVGTRNSYVRSCERELRIAMHRNGVSASMKVHDRVARFATVVIRRPGELVVMHIFVAIAAIRESDFVYRFFPCRYVAFRAFHGHVLSL